MKAVRVCGPVAEVVREVADYINGSDVSAPKAIAGPGVLFIVTDEPLTMQLLRHEQHHEKQAATLEPRWIPKWGPLGTLRGWIGWKRFYAAYAVEYARVGYWANHFEVEARKAAGEEP